MRLLALVLILTAAVAASACGADGAQTAATPTLVGKQLPPQPGLTVIAVGRDFGVGTNRLPLAILKADGASINDRAADIEITYGPLDRKQEPLSTATWRAWPVLNGVYVIHPTFFSAGLWEFRVTLKDGASLLQGSATVQVGAKPAAPAPGDAAPPVNTKTGSTPAELRLITSAADPDPDLYRLSLADALASGMPTVVSFSTPAFCSTQTCGPQTEVISKLQDVYGQRAHFIHAEIWDNPREMLDTGNPGVGRVSPAVTAWKLPSEPWTFLIGSDGKVFSRFEAFATEAELDEAVRELLAAS